MVHGLIFTLVALAFWFVFMTAAWWLYAYCRTTYDKRCRFCGFIRGGGEHDHAQNCPRGRGRYARGGEIK